MFIYKNPCATFPTCKKFGVRKRQVLIVSFLFAHFVGSVAQDSRYWHHLKLRIDKVKHFFFARLKAS